ncbi:MAG: energy-coupling factor transporter transmembrane component T, partial [Bacillota bacterium]
MNELAIVAGLIPGDSFLHRMHPMAKILWLLGILAVTFVLANLQILLAMVVLAVALIVATRTLRGYVAPMLFLAPIIFGLLFFQCVAPALPQPWTAMTRVGPFTIYHEGVYNGLVLSLRILSVASFSMLFIMTTHPGDLFATLRRIGIPHELSFMATTTLQLIPILQREFAIVLSAQKSRAMKASGFAALLPSIVPVFAGAIERVQQLAMTLEARAFGSKGVKTSLREIQARWIDYLIAIVGPVATGYGAVFLVLNHGLSTRQTTRFPVSFGMLLFIGSAAAFFAFAGYFVKKAKGSA